MWVLCCHPIYSERQVWGRTSRGHTGESRTRLFHLPFAVCTNELVVLHLLDFFSFIVFVKKNPGSCDCTEIRTHVPTSEGFEVTN